MCAETVLRQLGGGRFVAMTGAKNMMALPCGGLQVQLARFPGVKTTAVRVELTPADTYRVEGFACRGFNVKSLWVAEGVHADQLRGVFEANTGLRVTL
jgi:hypothetical protein